MKHFDYIVVGGGSAGCVLASRLSENPDCRVLLLEAGPSDWNPLIKVPAGVLPILKSRKILQWPHTTAPQAHLDKRRLYYPHGKVLGGSSAMNGMMWVRGNPQDYDHWNIPGWSYEEILPYFRKSESTDRGGNRYRGDEGPVAVSHFESHHPLSEAFYHAAIEAGYPATDDFNGEHHEGIGYYDFNVSRGRRNSMASAYLNKARYRDNLEIITGAAVSGIRLEGQRVKGLEYIRHNTKQALSTEGEIILCSGAVDTPRILMLSGIGRAGDLEKHGIHVEHDLPGVGYNLQDHLQVSIHARCKQPATLYSYMNPMSQALTAMQWLLFKTGQAGNIGVDGGGFIKSDPTMDTPDIQLNFMRASLFDHGRVPMKEHSFMSHGCMVSVKSRGYIGLQSSDPLDPPVIQPNYLDEEQDRITLREATRAVRNIFNQPAMAEFTGEEISPGNAVQTDADIDAFVRQYAESVFHPVGTCAMGSVVDENLKVKGLDGLRVADASVMPVIPSGNTQAPVVMIAEKAADLIANN